MRSILSCSAFLLSTIIIGTILPNEAVCPMPESSKDRMEAMLARYCKNKGYDSNSDESDEADPVMTNPRCRYNESANVAEQFQKFDFIPQIINRAPRQLLVAYASTYRIRAGNYLPPFTLGYRPRISYEANPGTLYTLVALNVDGNYVVNRTYEELVLSLLVVNIPGGDRSRGDVLLAYQPILPYPGLGAQRYAGFLYEQRRRINVTPEMKFRVATTANLFNFRKFVRETNLGDPFAGNFFLTSLSECSSSFTGYC